MGSTMPRSQAVLLHELFGSATARCCLSDSAYFLNLARLGHAQALPEVKQRYLDADLKAEKFGLLWP